MEHFAKYSFMGAQCHSWYFSCHSWYFPSKNQSSGHYGCYLLLYIILPLRFPSMSRFTVNNPNSNGVVFIKKQSASDQCNYTAIRWNINPFILTNKCWNSTSAIIKARLFTFAMTVQMYHWSHDILLVLLHHLHLNITKRKYSMGHLHWTHNMPFHQVTSHDLMWLRHKCS